MNLVPLPEAELTVGQPLCITGGPSVSSARAGHPVLRRGHGDSALLAAAKLEQGGDSFQSAKSPPTVILVCFSLTGGELATLLLAPGVWIVDPEGNVERLDKRPSKQSSRPLGLAAPLLGGACDDAVTSPDGRYVVYTAGTDKMYAIDLQTGSSVALGAGDLCHGMSKITWAPTMPQFLRWGYSLPLELVNATDGHVQKLASTGLWPAWSPDTHHIAYWQSEAQGYALRLLNLDDLKPLPLTSPSPDDPARGMPFVYDMTPHWSPDGDSIAFVSFREEHPEAYLLQLSDVR